MIIEVAALLVDDMTSIVYKRKGVVSKTSLKAWRQLMLEISPTDNLKYQQICSICPSYV